MSKLNGAKNHPQQTAKRQRTTLFGDTDLTDEVDDRGTHPNTDRNRLLPSATCNRK